MSNTTKLLMIILMVVTAVIVVQLIDQPLGEKGAVQRERIMGKGSLDIFVSESHSYEDRFLFTYTPRNPGSRFDCYMSYEFREDGNSLENVTHVGINLHKSEIEISPATIENETEIK